MNLRSYSAALPASVNTAVLRHLLRSDGQEDLCFGLWYPSQGHTRMTGLIQKLILPLDGERLVHGNASFLPHYFERAITEAVSAGAGLAFMHSHLGPGWQDMSGDDIRAENKHAPATFGATGLPLLGLTLGTDGAWSARFWERTKPRTYERRWCTHVRVVGDQLFLTYNDELIPPPTFKEELRRTISSWGELTQRNIARLRIGIVGAGSVGSIVTEALARSGVRRVTLLDFDTVEFVNLDRLLHAMRTDALLHRAKVHSLGKGLRQSATADKFEVDELEYSVSENDGFRAALDCDVLFSCVDRPWGRSVLNFIAYAHLIPVVDGGIQVEAKPTGLRRADWRAHVAGPEHRCLECLGQYNSGLVAAEREGYFDDPKYIAGLPADHPLRRNENVFAFSLSAASFEVLQMLMMVIAPLGIASSGAQMYHFVPGILDQPDFRPCIDNCPYIGLISKGDSTGLVVTGQHQRAEMIRQARAAAQRNLPLRYRLVSFLERLISRLQ